MPPLNGKANTGTAVSLAIAVAAEPPSLEDNTADLDRLKRALRPLLPAAGRPLRIPFPLVADIAARFRDCGFRGCAVVNMLPERFELVDFLPEKPVVFPAMALDLGTTHLEASLIDLLTGQRLAVANRPNSQIRFGADILNRIHFATSRRKSGTDREVEQDGLVRLQEAVLEDIGRLAEALAREAHIQPAAIRGISIAGNTTMTHLLLGLDPYHICREPYIPLVNSVDPLAAGELGLNIAPAAPVWILPSRGSYFGGDLVSGILASGLDQQEQTCMLIDVGTNAEVVLGNRDWLIACAGAAGPALEGGVARMGMRAAPGAIESVRIDRQRWCLEYQTIGREPARGLCGSGLIDLVAELYLARIIDLQGKIRLDCKAENAAQEAFLRSRLGQRNGEPVFVVVPAEQAAGNEPVTLSQVDLDALIRSKAAMYAILTTLLAQVGLEFSSLERIYVAGAFGRHIDPARAVTLGMLPDLDLSVYRPIGNSSLQGAELLLQDEQVRMRSYDILNKITYIELNVNQEFMNRFSGCRFIPHTDPSLFPSVPVFSERS